MLAGVFIYQGVDAIRHTDDHIEKFDRIRPALEKAGIPPVLAADARLLARATGVTTVAAGLGLATGRLPRFCATVLAVLYLPLTLVQHPFWSKRYRNRATLNGVLQNVAVAGGLIFAIFDRAGNPSLAWQLRNYRQHRAEISAAKSAIREQYAS